MADMISVLEVTPMVPSFPQESWRSKRELLHFKSVYEILLSGHHYLFGNIDFLISPKDALALKKLKFSLDIFFPLGILLSNSVVSAFEVVYLV